MYYSGILFSIRHVLNRLPLRYIYNPKTEEENREIMNQALYKK